MDLAELIGATKGDRSYADLERAAGGSPGAKRWQQLATKPQSNFPDPPTIRGMARALGVGEARVVLSAAESLGLSVRPQASKLMELLPPRTEELTEEQVGAVLAVVRGFLQVTHHGSAAWSTAIQATRDLDVDMVIVNDEVAKARRDHGIADPLVEGES